ncbi:MAG: hydroxymethylbilane synthase [Proteobacteria bacterium]|jgi:hydroxymethylbilane synthase|nr:hydroxymethylbilane synthase [Pseudomonadota bacterium]
MNKRKIVIGSRGSKLALIYANRAKLAITEHANIENIEIEIKEIVTKGDQVQDKRLSEVGGKGLFSKNIENELLNEEIDIAVHALKDMPATENIDLYTNCFLSRNDPREILISNNKLKLNELKKNAVIGTSSFRREFQIKKIRDDLICKLIRGNVDTRIQKLEDGLYDAIILSFAGIKSMNLENKITQIFSTEEIIPSVGQGVIALQCRKNDNEIISLLNKINDQKTYFGVLAERNILKVLEGDCETAVGAYATINNKEIFLEAELFSLDGSQRFYHKDNDLIENAETLGIKMGKYLKKISNNSYKK